MIPFTHVSNGKLMLFRVGELFAPRENGPVWINRGQLRLVFEGPVEYEKAPPTVVSAGKLHAVSPFDAMEKPPYTTDRLVRVRVVSWVLAVILTDPYTVVRAGRLSVVAEVVPAVKKNVAEKKFPDTVDTKGEGGTPTVVSEGRLYVVRVLMALSVTLPVIVVSNGRFSVVRAGLALRVNEPLTVVSRGRLKVVVLVPPVKLIVPPTVVKAGRVQLTKLLQEFKVRAPEIVCKRGRSKVVRVLVVVRVKPEVPTVVSSGKLMLVVMVPPATVSPPALVKAGRKL